MRHGGALLLLAVAQAALAAVYLWEWPPVTVFLLAWSAVSFAVVGAAYYRRTPGVFGKRGSDGRLAPLAVLLVLPYLLLTWGLWRAGAWLSRERACDEVAPGLFLGRWPDSARSLPPGIALVADLTAEFAPFRGMAREGRGYRCLAMLDGAGPTDETAFRAFVAGVAASPGPVYVHCAKGHGRSALAVAAILLERGLADGPEDALSRVRAARPGIRLSREQHALLERLYRT